MKIIANRVRCKKCNDIIESKHRHDFQSCKCGAIFIDGGTDYRRFGWGGGKPRQKTELEDYIDFSYTIYEETDS